MKKPKKETVLQEIKREHPNLPRVAQKVLARTVTLQRKSKLLGNWVIKGGAK